MTDWIKSFFVGLIAVAMLAVIVFVCVTHPDTVGITILIVISIFWITMLGRALLALWRVYRC